MEEAREWLLGEMQDSATAYAAGRRFLMVWLDETLQHIDMRPKRKLEGGKGSDPFERRLRSHQWLLSMLR